MHKTTQRGVLLVESLVAILVFSVGVLGAVTMQAQALRHIGEAHCRAEAAHLAHALIAAMSTIDPAALRDGYDSSRGGAGYRSFAAESARLPGARLPGNAPVVSVAAGPSAASRTIAVTLRWQMPGESQPHRYVLAAVIGRN